MDIHDMQAEGCTHVVTIHRGEKDDSPLHMISLARLERYWAIEALARELAALLAEAGSPGPAGSADYSKPGS